MSTEAIRTRIELSGQTLPVAALLAAQERPDELAAMVATLIDETVDETVLLLEEEDLLVFGLLALAAARHTGLCRPFLRLLRGPDPFIVRLLGDAWADHVGAWLLALYDGDDATLRELLLDPESSDDLRGLLFDVLARLVADGRADRVAFEDLLDRFDRENLAEPEDLAWLHWQDAVLAIGAAALTERVRQGWKNKRVFAWREVDQQDWLEQMRLWGEGGVPQTLAGDLEPLDDAAGSYAWSERATDDRIGAHLTFFELDWLDRTLLSVATTGKVMLLEQADGFFTAVLCGPRPVSFADCEAPLWENNPNVAVFDRPEVDEAVRGLLQKHFLSIAARLVSGEEMDPYLDTGPEDYHGALWATGFFRALTLDQEAWQRLSQSQRGQDALAHIIMLAPDLDEPEGESLSPSARRAVARRLPEIIQGIRRFWRSGPSVLPKLEAEEAPRGPRKIGRNQPCPCGSGKKYKKCCGAEV